MKTVSPFIIAMFLLLGFSQDTLAQNYSTAVGARLGYPLSASIKHFFTDQWAGEAYLGTRGYSGYRWVNLSLAAQKHNPIEDVEGLSWYFGAGASVYFWNFDDVFPGGDNFASATIGLQGYLGLDYTFANIPLNLTADWIPTLFFGEFSSGFGGGYGSLGVRYVLGRNE